MTRRVEDISGKEEMQRELTGWLRHLPQRDPPCDLAAMVLARITAGRRAPLWRRWTDRLRTPWVVTLRPLSMLSMTAAAKKGVSDRRFAAAVQHAWKSHGDPHQVLQELGFTLRDVRRGPGSGPMPEAQSAGR